MLQITPLMAYLLREAQGMTIGGNILLLPLLNPVHVAEEAATLDVLSGGNFVLGVGLGYRQGEFDAFGISLKDRAPRFVESIALMRRLWTEERVTFEGRFYHGEGPRHQPEAAAARRPTGLGGRPGGSRGEARRADWRRLADRQCHHARRHRAADADLSRRRCRTPAKQVTNFPIARECYVGASHATAMDECRAALEYKYNSYAAGGWKARQPA